MYREKEGQSGSVGSFAELLCLSGHFEFLIVLSALGMESGKKSGYSNGGESYPFY